MRYLRQKSHAGTEFRRLPRQNCLWCVEGISPSAPDIICESCRVKFKRLLSSKGWNKGARLECLALHPFCACGDPAVIADHIQPWSRRPDLFWEPSNHQGQCSCCHNHKTIRQDGGYGNQRKISDS